LDQEKNEQRAEFEPKIVNLSAIEADLREEITNLNTKLQEKLDEISSYENKLNELNSQCEFNLNEKNALSCQLEELNQNLVNANNQIQELASTQQLAKELDEKLRIR
jgi:chromosome segregation ATPase